MSSFWFGTPFQFSFNPCMNFFMPFGFPRFGASMYGAFNPSFNPFVARNPFMIQQQTILNALRPTPYNLYGSIFNSGYSRPGAVSSVHTTTPVTYSSRVTSTPKAQKSYNKAKGQKLAQTIVENLPTDRDPDNPLCARYVKNAVQDCGLGEYVNGNGEYCKNIFRANPNFKEIKSNDFSKLPAGSIVVYDAFDKVTYPNGSTGKVGKDGHVLVALGDGRGCSDIMEDQIGYSKNAYTFIPV